MLADLLGVPAADRERFGPWVKALTTLQDNGFGPSLLCSVLAFRTPAGAAAYLVYLYKQGTFYPFAPKAGQQRDALLERQIRDAVAGDLRMEEDPSRWLALWNLPV